LSARRTVALTLRSLSNSELSNPFEHVDGQLRGDESGFADLVFHYVDAMLAVIQLRAVTEYGGRRAPPAT